MRLYSASIRDERALRQRSGMSLERGTIPLSRLKTETSKLSRTLHEIIAAL
jgi:hypothetical protein